MWLRLAVLGGIAGAAAWFQHRRRSRSKSDGSGVSAEVTPMASGLDDDSAAEIIRRARPALERARGLY